MKRTTILIYKDSTDPKKGLKEATQEEWSAILKSNKGLPMCKRRCFIEDSFEDCGVIDRMFIEVSYDAYKEWHREDALKGKNMTAKKEYRLLSMDCPIKGSDGGTLMDTLPSIVDIEGNILTEIMYKELRKALEEWRPWANELLDYSLSGTLKSCIKELCKKDGVSLATMYRRKRSWKTSSKIFLEWSEKKGLFVAVVE